MSPADTSAGIEVEPDSDTDLDPEAAGTVLEPTIDVHLGPHDLAEALRADVAAGLSQRPLTLPSKWFYDDVGSALFDTITRLHEYYPTRAEREILTREAPTIVAIADADTIVELGSGTSDKTRALLDAGRDTGRLARFVPFDVSAPFLRSAARQLAERYPGLAVHGVVGDFDRHLHTLPRGGRRMVVMLGGTIGNYVPAGRAKFFSTLAATMAPGDHLLLGTDLVKDPARLEAAYDDPIGVTAAFNRNVLAVVDRELDADFDLRAFDHRAFWDPDHEWIEMHLVSRRDQQVRIGALDLDLSLAAGESIHTEVSAKFRRERVVRELDEAGFDPVGWWTDAAGDFGVSLSRLR